MTKKQIYDQLDYIHRILAKCEIQKTVYDIISTRLIEIKESILDSSEIELASKDECLKSSEKLCKIYFDIAAGIIGDDAVRKIRDEKLKA